MLKKFALTIRILLVAVVVVCFAVMLGGCGVSNGTSAASEPKTGYNVVDSEGTTVHLQKKPMRILSQSLTFDSMILGIVPPERLIACNILGGDQDSSFIVEETKGIATKLKSFTLIPTDLVLKLKPDLIILPNTAKPEMIATFRDLGYPVLVCKSPATIEDVKEDITLIARALQEEAAGAEVIAEMDRQLQEIEAVLAQQTGRPPVGLLVSQMTSYGGKNSMFDTVCTKARVTNGIAMVGLSNGEKLTKELVVKADPDFFMVSAPKKDDRYGSQKFKDEFLQDPAYQGMKGLKNIVAIPNRYLYTNSQNCVYAIKGIANYAYGSIFDLSEEHLIKGY